jgi:hypothetical protein
MLSSQGLLNNGARVVLTNGANIYINGTTGHLTNQNAGQITNNSAGGTITLLGNWINNAANIAFSNDGATVVMSGANQSIGGSNPTAFYNLTLAGTGTKQLSVNQTTVGGQSTFSGILALGSRPLDLNSNYLNVTNSSAGAITYGTGYVLSETNVGVNPSILRWYLRTSVGSHIYPFGVAGTQIPFTFNVTAAMPATTDYVEVSTRKTTTGLNTPWAGASNVAAVSHMFSPLIGADGSQQVVIDRWWDIRASNTVTADVTFSYLGSENTLTAPYNAGNLGAQHWDGVNWEPPVGAAPAVLAGVGAVTASGLSTFSPWVLSSLLAPLPIELIDANIHCVNNSVILSWVTVSEKNNDYFTVLRSYDGVNYTELTKIAGSGTSFITRNYSYTDYTADKGKTIYYKLLQTDYSKQSKLVKMLSTESCGGNETEIKVNNSEEGKVTVSFYLQQDASYSLMVYDVLGRQVRSKEVFVKKGFDFIELETSGLSDSYYILNIQSNNNFQTQKIYISH